MDARAQDAALVAVARSIVAVSTRAADQLRVSVVQLRALTVLSELDGASLGRLAEAVGVTPSTTSRLVDRLVTGGYVDRRTSPESRRQIELRLTPEGEATVQRYDDLRMAELRAALQELPADRRDGVVAALAEFADATRSLREPARVAVSPAS